MTIQSIASDAAALKEIQEWLRLDSMSPSWLVWAKNGGNGKRLEGAPALISIGANGYYTGQLHRKNIYAHRAVFALVHGCFPEQVDHTDGNKGNNSPGNLRAVTRIENQHNQRRAKGYSYHAASGKWEARLVADGKKYFLGLFDSEEAARAAYLEAKKIHHPTSPINSESKK